MKYIAKDDELFDLLKKFQVRILDSNILRINIFTQNHQLFIEIDFEPIKGEIFRLKFYDIREYSFYHNRNHHFRYVENLSLLKSDGLFYFTFDPEDERLMAISENDQDFILFGGFEGYFLGQNDLITNY
ncbi:hypothetical protein [Mucilaginibacter rubeus]|uniref:Uncharacterized protein n=1 Tax=Mucilaginibacter rubeus TaxID=2027860 RepID=A0A5C1HZU7_9SPHI|nr:hypothetical protein [Mucilaginibacter rubeus]QEM11163.1 hypothetical protein DEO27_014410 [Mucilaginibacter rubeus]